MSDTTTVYRAKDGWRWRRRSENGKLVSESGEAYENKGWAVHMATDLNPGTTLHLEDIQDPKES